MLQTPCGLLQHLCGMLQTPCVMLQPLRMLYVIYLGCCILYECRTGTMWAVAGAMWAIESSMWAFASSMNAAQALCGLFHPSCELSLVKIGKKDSE